MLFLPLNVLSFSRANDRIWNFRIIPEPIYIHFIFILFEFGIDLKTANLSSNLWHISNGNRIIFSFIQIPDSMEEERIDENMHNVMMADGG